MILRWTRALMCKQWSCSRILCMDAIKGSLWWNLLSRIILGFYGDICFRSGLYTVSRIRVRLQRAPGYNEQISLHHRIESNDKMFSYNQHPLKTISFFCIVLLVVGPSANFSAKELCGQCWKGSVILSTSNGVFTLAISGTETRTDIMLKPFTLAVSGARTGHLKAIEISFKHTT